jgi:hypothetical protein
VSGIRAMNGCGDLRPSRSSILGDGGVFTLATQQALEAGRRTRAFLPQRFQVPEQLPLILGCYRAHMHHGTCGTATRPVRPTQRVSTC